MLFIIYTLCNFTWKWNTALQCSWHSQLCTSDEPHWLWYYDCTSTKTLKQIILLLIHLQHDSSTNCECVTESCVGKVLVVAAMNTLALADELNTGCSMNWLLVAQIYCHHSSHCHSVLSCKENIIINKIWKGKHQTCVELEMMMRNIPTFQYHELS